MPGEWWGDDAGGAGDRWWCSWSPTNLQPKPRDYYRVEDIIGRRFWLYRLDLYGPRGTGAEPRWFIHGLFA
ncbi:MAG: hypothetical protein U5K75_07625 [Ahrensia sp.]|nr:hypothetical protein [Ahrensia sp.]